MSTISGIEKEIGNTLIRYNDKWRGPCYLTEDLSFTTDKSQAARFYLLKSSDTMILNGDTISFNNGNRIVTVNEHDKVAFLDRQLIDHETNTFIVTNGLDNTEPIGYDTPLFIIAQSTEDISQYERGLCYLNPGFKTPALLSIATINKEFIHTFTFYLERVDNTITNRLTVSNKKYDESYRNAIIIVLLLVVLILTMVVNK